MTKKRVYFVPVYGEDIGEGGNETTTLEELTQAVYPHAKCGWQDWISYCTLGENQQIEIPGRSQEMMLSEIEIVKINTAIQRLGRKKKQKTRGSTTFDRHVTVVWYLGTRRREY